MDDLEDYRLYVAGIRRAEELRVDGRRVAAHRGTAWYPTC